MKIIFAGTPDIAKTVLNSLIENKFNIELVLTMPDRPAGRGNKITPPPVKELALALNIPVMQPLSLRHDPDTILHLKNLNPDIMVVIAYGMILPPEVLAIPKLGCINIHVSLLPKWRGAAPIARAIINGDSTTGVTLMQMDAGLDTGDILMQQAIAIDNLDNAKTLHDKLAHLGSKMIVEYLNHPSLYPPQKQSEVGVSYAHKITKAEALIKWSDDAKTIKQHIAGFNPSPGAFSYLNGKLIKFWNSQITDLTSTTPPGTISITNGRFLVSCGNNTTLELLEIQLEGRARQSTNLFINGNNWLLDTHPHILGESTTNA